MHERGTLSDLSFVDARSHTPKHRHKASPVPLFWQHSLLHLMNISYFKHYDASFLHVITAN
jgi:hypothetical protein